MRGGNVRDLRRRAPPRYRGCTFSSLPLALFLFPFAENGTVVREAPDMRLPFVPSAVPFLLPFSRREREKESRRLVS